MNKALSEVALRRPIVLFCIVIGLLFAFSEGLCQTLSSGENIIHIEYGWVRGGPWGTNCSLLYM